MSMNYLPDCAMSHCIIQVRTRFAILLSICLGSHNVISNHTVSYHVMLGWTVKSFIVKAGDDLRKEVLAMQLIEYCQHVFGIEGLDISLRPYQIVSTGQQSGRTHLPLHSLFSLHSAFMQSR